MTNEFFLAMASNPVTVAIGWALIHFLWQAAIVGGVAACLLVALRRQSANMRYLVACGGLLLMATAPVVTASYYFLRSTTTPESTSAKSTFSPEQLGWAEKPENQATTDDSKTLDRQEQGLRSLNLAEATPAGLTSAATDGRLSKKNGIAQKLEAILPAAVAIWSVCVGLLSIRLLGGVSRVRRLRSTSVFTARPGLGELFAQIAIRLKVTWRVEFFESGVVSVPMVIGWLRPVVLVPAGMISGLAPSELEALLAHELAHIRRHDYLVNFLQTIVETLFFYHPAVWWVSRQIRALREDCCDDKAIQFCGNRVVFARALARLEELRSGPERLAVAATGGILLRRIRRVVGCDDCPTGGWWIAGLASILLLTGLFAAIGLTVARVEADTRSQTGGDQESAAQEVADHATINTPRQTGNSNEVVAQGEDRYPTHKLELTKVDARTGATKRVLADVKLSANGTRGEIVEHLDFVYSSVFAYTVIPERVARALNAQEIGEIDFGTEAPQAHDANARLFESIINQLPMPNNTPKEPDANGVQRAQTDSAAPSGSDETDFDYVNSDVGDRRNVVFQPYPNSSIWIPGHLGFYNMNSSQQHRFKVVRIDAVDLGIGPKFGPVNALVSSDINSEFGVLGSDWAAIPRGPNGEGFIHSATDGFFFGNISRATEIEPAKPTTRPLESRADGQDEHAKPFAAKVLAQHTYDQRQRSSKDWIELNGVSVPVDDFVEHAGVRVYVGMMFDVIAVDAATGKVLWSIPWNKSMPIYDAVAIVELTSEGKPQLAVRLTRTGGDGNAGEHDTFRSLTSGKEIKTAAIESKAADQTTSKHRSDPPDDDPNLRVISRDGDTVTLASLAPKQSGRSAPELVRHFKMLYETNEGGSGEWVTNMETLISSDKVRYVFDSAMDADEVIFNLPEGSGIRAEFQGKNVAITQLEGKTQIVVTEGKVELIDVGGVVRATASPDGGAEQIVVTVVEQNDEYMLTLAARRIKPDREYPNPPVQVKMNLQTGAPADEEQPPHGAIRYEILAAPEDGSAPIRLKMKWHYDLKRLAEEAQQQTGKSLDDLLNDETELEPQTIAPIRILNDADDFGPKPANGDLRLRLTLLDENPKVGEPVRLKLEIKNFGGRPQSYDPQYYASFRVLRVCRNDGTPDMFIGMTPQTAGHDIALEPGQTNVLWESEDASELFMLDEGTYQVEVAAPRDDAGALPGSNTIEFAIQPGKLPPLKALIKHLGKNLPEKWQLANGWGAVYLTHLPTNLKRDASGIQIWFTPEKLPEGYQLGAVGDRKIATAQIVTQFGKCELGYLNVAAQPRVLDIWPGYLEYVRTAAEKALTFVDNDEDEKAASDEDAARTPWSVFGRVTDRNGKPIQGATVRAHCGIGTLHQTGSAESDAEGNYSFRFGPGIWSENRQTVQAATISVHLDGHAEQNLHRHGDLLAALELPEGDIGWGGKTADDLFLPGKPRELDFVMVPAARLAGLIINEDGDKLDGVRVSLTGEEMPPSSSVVANTRTDKGGRFELSEIPSGFAYQILVEPAKAESPWLAWASPPIVFTNGGGDGTTHLKYVIDEKTVDFGFQQMTLVLKGAGVNWKTALANAADRRLNLKWNGLSAGDIISASDAYLELSDRE